jgi:hypothetical protein
MELQHPVDLHQLGLLSEISMDVVAALEYLALLGENAHEV